MPIGRVRGGAVRLSPLSPTLVIAEGIEDGLSVLQLKPGVTVWATLGSQNLGNQAIPETTKNLVIAADADPPGQKAANEAALKYAALGWTVKVVPPPKGKDWNEYLKLKKGLKSK